jgi:2-C-methyl-D-erythritol 4-phosphate cytidylyltransferase
VRVWAIVLAAGSGTRFGGAKQFATLGDRSLVDIVVTTAASVCESVVVVLPEGIPWKGQPVAAAVSGGSTRAASVRRGLAVIPEDVAIVVIHDAAHPLASPALFEAVIASVREGADGAVPVLPLAETTARVEEGRLVTTESARGNHVVQTPHAFRAACLRSAHASSPDATDDASLLVARGHTVVTVSGDPRNIHISTPEELTLAAQLLLHT